ncbi:MAG: hypothetical protein L6R28_08310 [Planctomycetes bacterium]|nr:hypothetical protein [Planctomycetota bacterium]
MDAAAYPAGEAFPAQPEVPPALAKPAEPPPLEPGAKWKALPYKLRKTIENAASVAVLAIYFPPLIAWGCWANARFVAWRRPLAEEKLLVSDAITIGVVLALAFLIFAGYRYLRRVSPNKALLWDGIRGYYHKWRTHRNNARAAVVEMVADPALRPEKDVRTVASIGRDALVFGILAALFAIAAASLLACHLLGFFDKAEDVSEPLLPGEVFLLVTTLASVVLGLLAAAKAGGFVSAWRRFVFASAKRGVLGWWREFSTSDDWKRFASIRPAVTIRRSVLFALLLAALVWGTHACTVQVVSVGLARGHSRSNKYVFTICRLEPFSYFTVFECSPDREEYRIWAHDEFPNSRKRSFWGENNWYLANEIEKANREGFRRAQLIGWTGARMESEITRAVKDLGMVQRLGPVTADEFEVILETLDEKGFSYTRKDQDFTVQFNGRQSGIAIEKNSVWGCPNEIRVCQDDRRLIVLDSNKFREEYEVFDFSSNHWVVGSIRNTPLLSDEPETGPMMHLTFWLAVFALTWSILFAPLFFLRFTYDPDKERAQQAAAPSPAPAAPPST